MEVPNDIQILEIAKTLFDVKENAKVIQAGGFADTLCVPYYDGALDFHVTPDGGGYYIAKQETINVNKHVVLAPYDIWLGYGPITNVIAVRIWVRDWGKHLLEG